MIGHSRQAFLFLKRIFIDLLILFDADRYRARRTAYPLPRFKFGKLHLCRQWIQVDAAVE